jgi:hypothetical protein
MRKLGLILLACLTAATLCACGNIAGNEETAPAAGAESALTVSNITSSESAEPTFASGEVAVSTLEELKTAAADTANTKLHIAGDIDISEEYTLERADDLEVVVDEGVTLTVSGAFTIVSCTLTNNGDMFISGSFVYGISNLINNGSMTIGRGKVTSGQSNAVNNGEVAVEMDGQLFIERGTIFDNAGSLINQSYICVQDGGQLNDKGGTVVNNGTMDINSYYNGDITKITGTGTLNDNREQG